MHPLVGLKKSSLPPSPNLPNKLQNKGPQGKQVSPGPEQQEGGIRSLLLMLLRECIPRLGIRLNRLL